MKNTCLFLLYACVSITPAFTQKIWNGSASDDWDVAANWTPQGVPATAHTVTIPAVNPSPVVKSGVAAEARSIQLTPGSGLMVNSGGSLVVSGASFRGISNDGHLVNEGSIVISQTASDGMYIGNTGLLANTGTLAIGASGSIGLNGILNDGALVNNGGSIAIDNTANGGLVNLPDALYQASNGAILQIGMIGGLDNIANIGLINQGFVTNDASTITVDNTPKIGLRNLGNFTNQNGADIVIGGVGNIGLEGINSSNSFFNTASEIHIDRTGDDGLLIFGPFQNTQGSGLFIGQSGGEATIAQHGVSLVSSLVNDASTIVIDNVALHGISRTGSSSGLTNRNSGSITIGANGSIGQYALFSFFAGLLSNSACSDIGLFGTMYNESSLLINSGLLTLNASQPSVVIGTALTNHGVIEDIQGTLPGGTIQNFDLIVQPASGPNCPGLINDVLLVGAQNSISVGTQWFFDEELVSPAATYDFAGNALDVSGIDPGMYTLYFTVTNGCTQVVSIHLNIGDDPVELCNGVDDDCDGEIDETDLTVFLPECRTVYPGYAPAETATLTPEVSGGTAPYAYGWSPGNETDASIDVSPEVNTEYTVTITDAFGCQVAATVLVEANNVACGNGMVTVCHNGKTKCIGAGSVLDHLLHGDQLGACDIGVCEVYPGDDPFAFSSPVKPQVVEALSEAEVVDFSIYPNPARTQTRIRLTGWYDSGDIRLLDINGNVVFNQKTETGNGNIEISLDQIVPGAYLIMAIPDAGAVQARKLVVIF